MKNYKNIYFKMFNKLTDLINELITLQQEMEEIYISLESDENETNEHSF